MADPNDPLFLLRACNAGQWAAALPLTALVLIAWPLAVLGAGLGQAAGAAIAAIGGAAASLAAAACGCVSFGLLAASAAVVLVAAVKATRRRRDG